MEAIFELIGALIGAIVAGIVGLLVAVVSVVGSLLAFVVEMAFYGVTEASDRKAKRTAARALSVSNAGSIGGPAELPDELPTAAATSVSAEEPAPSRFTDRQTLLLGGLVLAGVVCAAIAMFVHYKITQQRIEQTRAILAKTSDEYKTRIKEDGHDSIEKGMLDRRDMWQRKLELFVDRFDTGTLIVVRSSGPDKEHGTADDLLKTRFAWKPAREIGGRLVGRGVDAAKQAVVDRFRKLFPKADEVEVDDVP